MLKKILISLGVIGMIASATPAMAAEFQAIGYEAVSMGGAGVAATRGSYAPYFNPALLARPRHSVEVTVSTGIGYRDSNLVDHIDTLSEIDVDATLESLENINYGDLSGINVGDEISVSVSDPELSTNVATIKRELRAMSHGDSGMELMPNAALAAQVGHWGLGAYMVSEATAFAVVDGNRVDAIVRYDYGGTSYYVEYNEADNAFYLSDQTEYESRSLDYAVQNETTYLDLTGLAYGEVPVAYGLELGFVPGKLSVGGSVKFMTAKTYSSIISIDTESGDIRDELENSEKSDSTLGLDLGVLYSPPVLGNLSLGLVAKNINKPEFDTPAGGALSIDPQIRAGAALDLFGDSVTLAFDVDLSVNETFIEGYDTQYAGGGISFHPASWCSLRAGAMKNLKYSDEGLILTAGVGLGLKWFQLDLAAQMSLEEGEFDDTEVPRYGRVQLAFVSKWN